MTEKFFGYVFDSKHPDVIINNRYVYSIFDDIWSWFLFDCLSLMHAIGIGHARYCKWDVGACTWGIWAFSLFISFYICIGIKRSRYSHLEIFRNEQLMITEISTYIIGCLYHRNIFLYKTNCISYSVCNLKYFLYNV